MTKEGLRPATPGTAARCEEPCKDTACFALAICTACKKPLHECSPDSYPEHWRIGYERLKAENASLREGAFEWKHEAEKRRMGYERAEQQNTSLLESLRESQKRADMNGDLSSQWHDKWAAAEKRSTELDGALRKLVGEVEHEHCGACDEYFIEQHGHVDEDCGALHYATAQARAALHDEERPMQLGECVGHLGPPSNTGDPHPKGATCSFWKPVHDEERSAATAAPESVPESLPTRASLLESLRAEVKTSRKRLAELTKYYDAHGKECLRLAAAEQRAEAAEKRNTELQEALRAAWLFVEAQEALTAAEHPCDAGVLDTLADERYGELRDTVRACAALHDEERRCKHGYLASADESAAACAATHDEERSAPPLEEEK